MREDMPRLLVGRPRLGARFRHTRRHRRHYRDRDCDHLPKQQGMRRSSPQSKYLNENLAPLLRLLERRLGRPWEKVYSEIRAHIRFDSVAQLHVLQHLERDIAHEVEIIDGVPYDRRRGRFLYAHPHSFYLCPRTGLLRCHNPPSRDPDKRSRKRKRKRRGSRRKR